MISHNTLEPARTIVEKPESALGLRNMDHGDEKPVAEGLTRMRWLTATDGELLQAISEGVGAAFDELFTRNEKHGVRIKTAILLDWSL